MAWNDTKIENSGATSSGVLNVTEWNNHVIDQESRAFVTSGSGAPSSTPSMIGAIYVDVSTGDVYIADAVASSADWNIQSSLSQEQVEDYAGSMIATGGTKTLITVTYQDSTNDMDFVVDSDLHNYSWTNVDATDLKVGSITQAYDADLTTIAGLSSADSNFIVGSATGWVVESGATVRTSLGLGSLATASTVSNSDWSGTDLAVANGGTGASDAAGAKTNLGFMTDLSDDTTPTLGGALDANSNAITGVTNIGYTYATGGVSALGNLGATEAISWIAASHFTGTLDSDVTITHTNEASGIKITLALSYDGTAQRTITWSDVDIWLDNSSGAAPTSPSASGEVLLVTMIYLGTTCYASATGNYAVY